MCTKLKEIHKVTKIKVYSMSFVSASEKRKGQQGTDVEKDHVFSLRLGLD